MKSTFVIIILAIAGFAIYYYFYSNNTVPHIELKSPLTVKCENDMKTMKFESADASNQYYIDCLDGKIYNQ